MARVPSGADWRLLSEGYPEILREDFAAFIHKCFITLNPGIEFLPNWHIELIAEYLQACRRREIKRLIINMPPRALKSICVSVAWPAFLLGHNPSERIMAASYAAGLSMKHSLDCRNVLLSDWYGRAFPDVTLSSSQNEKHKFVTMAFGHRIATSVGGSATGEGGNFLIVDDPQNPTQVLSDATRNAANAWFDHTFASRLDDKKDGVMVVVMQRLHADDLTGHLLTKGGWEHLCLTAIAERAEIYDFGRMACRRKRGEALHPQREDVAQLAHAKRELGSYAFEAQYQQSPLPMEGGMVRREWLRRYNQVPEEMQRIIQSWDTAIKAASHHDASACVTMGETTNGYYLLDVQVVRLEYPELKRCILQLAKDWQADTVLMEDKASGQSLLQDLRGEQEVSLIAIQPKGDKVMRMARASAALEAGKLWLPQEAPWVAAFEAELLAFPNGPHDDQVDALSQYVLWRTKTRSDGLRIRRL